MNTTFFNKYFIHVATSGWIVAGILLCCFVISERSIFITDIMFEDRITKLKNNFEDYKAINPLEQHISWWTLFDNSNYQLGGSIQWDRYDCSSAWYDYIRSRGGDPIMENSIKIGERLEMHKPKRKNIYQVRTTDHIILKPVWRGKMQVGHIGIVECVKDNWIYYVDMNNKHKGKGWRRISFDDQKIKAIYPLSFEVFAGASLNM